MIRLCLFCLLAFTLACSNNSPAVEETKTPVTEVETPPEPTPEPEPPALEVDPELLHQPADFIGSYVGDFYATEIDENKNYVMVNKINISIDSFDSELMYGHSVVAGNNRPFSGPYQVEEGLLKAEAKEPGDDRYDGVFTFQVNLELGELEGVWNAYNTRLPVYQRGYRLEPAQFKYDPNLELPENVAWTELYNQLAQVAEDYVGEGEFLTEDVLKLNPSKRLLTKEEIENLYKGDLEVIRNSIYARHGYSFKNRKIRFIFDKSVDWYIPHSTDIRSQLTEIELANIDLLKRYEQHADRYYDVFGR